MKAALLAEELLRLVREYGDFEVLTESYYGRERTTSLSEIDPNATWVEWPTDGTLKGEEMKGPAATLLPKHYP